MKFDFTSSFESSDLVLRPYVREFFLDGWDQPLTGLVDSGAVGCRVDADVARSAGIDLSKGSTKILHVGGSRKLAYLVPECQLPVLGMDGCFSQFEIRIKAASQRFYVLRK